MRKKCGFIVSMTLFISFWVFGQRLTVPELSGFSRTSLYADVMDFLFDMQERTDRISLDSLGTSTEGRMIPLVIASLEGIRTPSDQKLSERPVLLIMANIHAGEVEGKEAVLMLIRDIADSKMDDWLSGQTVLMLPIFNPDGNDKLGPNRRDNGPELAGVRYNGQYLDLNRDFLKIESPEVQGLIRLLNRWDPVLIIDLHTTNGSYHQEPVTYSSQVNPNTSETLRNYLWDKLFPAVSATLRNKYQIDSVPYGNFVDRFDPAKGWENDAIEARYGFNYFGLRNRFAILNENYSHADFKTRILGCYGFLKSILEYTGSNLQQMKKITMEADIQTRDRFRHSNFVLAYEIQKLFDLTVKSYRFLKEKIKPEEKDKYPPWFGDYLVKKTDQKVDYRLPYLSKAVPVSSTTLPAAYVLLPNQSGVIKKIRAHGILVQQVRKAFNTGVETYILDEITPEKQIYQGHVRLKIRYRLSPAEQTIPENAYLISMRQPLARLIPVLLEPASPDSLVAWGFFNREIVSQWTGKPMSYPVFRIPEISGPLPLVIPAEAGN